jgi:putative membrane protein
MFLWGGGTFSLGRWLYPCFALWYLLCLFYWRILLSVIPQKWNPKWIVVISIFISISVGFTNISGILGLHRFFSFMPYFMIGHYYGVNILQYADYKQFTPTHRKILVVSSFFVLMGLASLNPHWLDCIIQPYGSLKVFVIRIAYLCYSLLLCYLLVCIFNFKHDWNENAVSRYGRDTLFFYLLHPYILYPMTILIGGAGKIINIFDSCLITVFTVAILLLMEKIRIIHSFIK